MLMAGQLRRHSNITTQDIRRKTMGARHMLTLTFVDILSTFFFGDISKDLLLKSHFYVMSMSIDYFFKDFTSSGCRVDFFILMSHTST